MANVSINETVRVTTTFRTQGVASDPVSVVVNVLDAVNVILYSASAVNDDVGVYHYDWTPNAAGVFDVQFVGTFSDSTTDNVDTRFTVGATVGVQATLGQDQYLQFLVNPTPMVLDPDEFLAMFPDSNSYEVSELIYQFSSEAQAIMGSTVQDAMQLQIVIDFVEASVACALTRIYDITGGADESTITLGDLTVSKRNTVKAGVTRANATTWCELAGVIRNELYALTNRGGMKAIVRGSKYFNPIPPRRIQHMEWRDWNDYSEN